MLSALWKQQPRKGAAEHLTPSSSNKMNTATVWICSWRKSVPPVADPPWPEQKHTVPSCLSPHTYIARRKGTIAGPTLGNTREIPSDPFLCILQDTSHPRCLDIRNILCSLNTMKYSGQTIPSLILPSDSLEELLDHQGQIMSIKDILSQPYSPRSGTEAPFIPVNQRHLSLVHWPLSPSKLTPPTEPVRPSALQSQQSRTTELPIHLRLVYNQLELPAILEIQNLYY